MQDFLAASEDNVVSLRWFRKMLLCRKNSVCDVMVDGKFIY